MQDHNSECQNDSEWDCATCEQDEELRLLCAELVLENHVGPIDDAWQFEACANAPISIEKSISPDIVYAGTELCITARLCNTTENPMTNVIFQDVLDATITFITGSVKINGSAEDCADLNPEEGFYIDQLEAHEACVVSFRASVLAGASPVRNIAYVACDVSLDEAGCEQRQLACSKPFYLVRLKYDFSKSCTDVVESVSLLQTAIAHVLNAEGEKIQALIASPCVSMQELLEANASVEALLSAVNSLELILQQVLSVVLCQLMNCLNRRATSMPEHSECGCC